MIPVIQKRKPRTISAEQGEIRAPRLQGLPSLPGHGYTIPRSTYRYEQVSWEVFMDNTYDGYKSVRSSFIPYVIANGEYYWLLGSFYDFPRDILTDFGGSCIIFDPPKKYHQMGGKQFRHYQHAFGCAMLELNEESKGLLVKPVLASLGTNQITVYRGTNDKYKEYVWFIMVPLDYQIVKPIMDRFIHTPDISIDEKLGPLDLYRVSDILSGKHRTSRNLTDFVNYLRQQ